MTDLFAGPPLRVGVVGLGLMGDRHCQVINHLERTELAAVCDRDPEVVSRVSIRYGTDGCVDYQELLARDDVDAVVLCLPSGLHAEYGVLAARAGKHVLVEKPIDSDLGSARKLVKSCLDMSVKCAVIHQNRYSAGLATLKRMFDLGAMGEPVMARASVKWYRHDEYYTGSSWRGRLEGEKGGVLINQAVHSLDTLQWYFGRPDNVAGYISNSRPDVVEMEDSSVAILRWNSGLIATLEASTAAQPGFDELYEFHTTKASATVEKGRITYWYHKDGITLPELILEAGPAELDGKLTLFYRQYQDILDAIFDQPNTLAGPEQSLEVLETIERIYQSTGR